MEEKVSALNRTEFWSQADPNYIDRLNNINCCLVMVPHPDDESLACAGLIAILIDRKVKINVILTTNGSMSHPNSKKYPSHQLVKLRKKEFEDALKLVGVGTDAIKYYNAQDGSMPTIGDLGFEELEDKLTKDLITIKPDLILVPYELDSHDDHKATHQLLISSLLKSKIIRPKIWEYPVWLYERANIEEIPKLKKGELIAVDIISQLSLKKRCIYAHQSQTTLMIDDDPNGFMLSTNMIENFIKGIEYFMERKKLNNQTTLSKKYFDDVYTNSTDPWNFETSDYERNKYCETVSAIPQNNYSKALEIGCSIGVLTKMLSQRCEHLLAMDINEIALTKVRERFTGSSNKVEFLLGGIPQDFPSGNFDLIVMSEVGYYLSMNDLIKARKKIWEALNTNGILILVHWIHFVHDYPLTGDEVHDLFDELEKVNLKKMRTSDYRMDVFQKI